jgi:hypothetical protein
MGWTAGWNSKKELVEHCLSLLQWQKDEQHKHSLLKHSVYGNELWCVQHIETPKGSETSLVLFLLSGGFKSSYCGNWGYKDMSIEMHPYYYNCPKSLVDMVSPSVFEKEEGAAEWLKQWKATHNRKSTWKHIISTAKAGDVVEFNNVIEDQKRGWKTKFMRIIQPRKKMYLIPWDAEKERYLTKYHYTLEQLEYRGSGGYNCIHQETDSLA